MCYFPFMPARTSINRAGYFLIFVLEYIHMNYYLIAPNKTFHSSDSLLTYSSVKPLKIGQIVIIPLGKKEAVGIVIKSVKQPEFETKGVLSVLYDEPLPKHLLKALTWLTDYYRSPMSSVVQAILPRGITKTRRKSPKALMSNKLDKIPENPLNVAQKRAVAQIEDSSANTVLLHGITGSGKTNIYIELAKHNLANGLSTIVLVPEIALTSQLVRNFEAHFEDIIILHSKQTEAVRHQIWEKALKSDQPQIVIGPRSALFAPVKDLGLVIIDEAHEPAYHQDQNPKYSALRLASNISKTILGTATPLVSDYFICKSHDAVVELNELAIKNDKTASIKVIDFKDRGNFGRSRLISNQLITSIQESLQNHTQSLIFHNRRGTATLTICDKCGWQALCPNCFLPLVLHADKYQMRCHTCGLTQPVPTCCPECQNASIHHKGFGTKLLEEELSHIFPHAKIARFDADTADDQQMNAIYDRVKSGDVDIIIGTQMIAKGFDFPKLTTLGVIQADAGLSLPDYSSEERTFELITQVIGRAKRGHQNSEIFIQSFQPEHPVIAYSVKNDYLGFYNYLLDKRRQGTLPPYSFLLKLSLAYKTETAAIRNVRKLNKFLIQAAAKANLKQIIISPAMPAFHERSNTGFNWQIVIKAKHRKDLLTLFDSLDKNPYLRYDFDPPTLL